MSTRAEATMQPPHYCLQRRKGIPLVARFDCRECPASCSDTTTVHSATPAGAPRPSSKTAEDVPASKTIEPNVRLEFGQFFVEQFPNFVMANLSSQI